VNSVFDYSGILPIYATSRMFEFGEKLARGAGVVTVALFVVFALGTKFGKVPTNGAAYGRVLAIRHFRWIGLVAVAVGLILMAVASA
jgi:hypothetical protein